MASYDPHCKTLNSWAWHPSLYDCLLNSPHTSFSLLPNLLHSLKDNVTHASCLLVGWLLLPMGWQIILCPQKDLNHHCHQELFLESSHPHTHFFDSFYYIILCDCLFKCLSPPLYVNCFYQGLYFLSMSTESSPGPDIKWELNKWFFNESLGYKFHFAMSS